MHICITNDDGIHAPGIQILKKQLQKHFTVTVVAPEFENSGISHALTLHRPLRLKQWDAHSYSVDGTPADAVFIAFHEIFNEKKPDLVISGINPGPNIGIDVIYSGTVAGAMEGTLLGCSGMSISMGGFNPNHDHYYFGGQIAANLCKKIPWQTLNNVLLNVTVPMKIQENPHFRLTTLEPKRPQTSVESGIDPRGKKFYWIGGIPENNHCSAGSDREAMQNEVVSISCLDLWNNDHNSLDDLRSVFKE